MTAESHRKIVWGDSALKLGCCNWEGLPLKASKGYPRKLLVVYSKCGLCNIWGLLPCDVTWDCLHENNRRKHGGSRSDAVMIWINFNSYLSLVVFFIIPFWFCFVFQHETIYTIRVLIVFEFLLPCVILQSNWALKL